MYRTFGYWKIYLDHIHVSIDLIIYYLIAYAFLNFHTHFQKISFISVSLHAHLVGGAKRK